MNRDLQLQLLSCQSQSKLLFRFGLNTTKCSSRNRDLPVFIKKPNVLIYITKQMLLASGLPFRNNSAEKKGKKRRDKKKLL